jgi:hypothetical protein
MFLGPLIALFVVGVLAAVLRWTFSGDDRAGRADPEDYGLLCTVAVLETKPAAESMRVMLTEAGIRTTVAVGADGLVRVLVFDNDFDHARRVVGWTI